MMNPAWRPALLLAALSLSGCGDSDVAEVKQWMQQVQQQARRVVAPLTEPKKFVPFAYEMKEEMDPFSPNKLLNVLAKASKSDGAFKPDMRRPKEALESFPLDTVKMVGTMQKAGVRYAVLQIDKAVYQVKGGQHLGQNFGLITVVDDAQVQIKEIVQDAGGEWVERMAKLELQESKEIKK